ncbi:MAG: hypothetical protein ACYC2T_07135 [Bacillota bacterium]
MLFSRIPVTLPETLLALGGELFFSGILGIIFAYLVPQIRSSNTFIKSWMYGTFSGKNSLGFSIYLLISGQGTGNLIYVEALRHHVAV